VRIDDFREFSGDRTETALKSGILDDLLAGFDGRRLAFDVREDCGDFRNLRPNFVFEGRNLVVSGLHGETLVHFKMLLDM
jgi:hypothetical protein